MRANREFAFRSWMRASSPSPMRKNLRTADAIFEPSRKTPSHEFLGTPADITSIGLKLLSGPKGSDVATDNVMDDGPSFDPFGLGDQEIVDNKLIRYSSAADLEIDSVGGKRPTFGWEHT
ncbi:hypothetical protein ACOSP7_021395 [Xanthoceras sorbifolium]